MNAVSPIAAAGANGRHFRGLLLVGASALLWSTGGLIVRSLDSADPWTTIFWRSAFAVLFLLAFLFVRDGRAAIDLFRRMGAPGLLIGVCFAAASVLFVVALSLTSVAQTLVIMSATPLLAALLGRLVLGEPVSRWTLVTIGVVMAGIVIMVSDELAAEGSLLGDLVACLIAVTLAGTIVITRKYPHIRMTPAACTGAAMAFVVAAPFAAPLPVTGHDMALLVVFGAAQLGLGMVLFVTGARLIPAAQSALIGIIEPIFGPAWVWLFIGEVPRTTTLVGGTIVIASILANTVHSLRQGTPEVR